MSNEIIFNREIAGYSSKMVELYSVARNAALTGNNIYIFGEIGSGKDILAEYIHSFSNKEGPLRILDVEKFNKMLAEDCRRELEALFSRAKTGTIYIKSLSSATLPFQDLLLEMIRHFQNDNEKYIRIIASSHINIFDLVDKRSFLRELMLLFPIELNIPPLYERKEDIEPLISIILKELDATLDIADDAKNLLLKYRWPGNVRELYNTLVYAKLYADNKVIRIASLPKNVRKNVELSAKSSTLEELYILSKGLLESGSLNQDINPYFEYLKVVETQFIKAALDLSCRNKSKAAELMRINRNTLSSKLKAYNINNKVNNGI